MPGSERAVRTVHVYEFRNESLKEIFVGRSDLPSEEFSALLRDSSPACLAHWNWTEHKIFAADVELSLPEDSAQSFIEEYLRVVTPQPGWKMLSHY